MTTQEYLNQVTIGKVSELSGRIELKEYDPAWSTLYEVEWQKINTALNMDGIEIFFSSLKIHRMKARMCLIWRKPGML